MKCRKNASFNVHSQFEIALFYLCLNYHRFLYHINKSQICEEI